MEESSGTGGLEKPRFDDASEEELKQLVEASVPVNTKKATAFWVGVFNDFCKEKEIDLDLKKCSPSELNGVLSRFYRGLRMKNGGTYKRSSYTAARASIARYIMVELGRPLNIFQAPELQDSNRVLNAVLVEHKRLGEPSVSHKTSILDEDEIKIDAYFSDVLTACDPVKLTQFCWYQVTTHFGLRAAEVQTQLKKDDISFQNDGNGTPFVTLSRDFQSKNAQGGLKGREFTTVGRIYDEQQIAALKLLLEKAHPEIDRLFQRARIPVSSQEDVWFMKCPLGHNIMRDMLPRISSAAGLSRRYTNHCLRATVVTKLKKAGLEDRKICRVTGHKNAQSLESYEQSSEKELRGISTILDRPERNQKTFDRQEPQPGEILPGPSREFDLTQRLIHAPQAVFHNVVINIASPDRAAVSGQEPASKKPKLSQD